MDSNFEGSHVNSYEQTPDLVDVFDLSKQLEEPRIQTCSFFVYTIDENSELSFLLRAKKIDSK